ncbi:MAG: ABC transporter permease [Planctomycetota bacterium]|jgi:ribose transport system permease protein|nr:ABC transporter permease [Planctomycetota bacterium]
MARLSLLFRERTVRTALFLLALLLFAWLMYGEVFLNLLNLRNVLRQTSMIGLIALGMTLVIVGGGIDLSVGAMTALASVTAAYLSRESGWMAIVGTIILGLLLGLLNGVLVAVLRIVPFIATLATMMTFRGSAYLLTDIKSIPVAPGEKAFTQIGRGYLLGAPLPALVFVGALGILYLFSVSTRPGRQIFAIGDNEEAARMMGVNVAWTKILSYAILGLLCGLSGIILTARLGAGQPVGAEGWEMNAIAAVLIGGTLLSGGVGSVVGTFFGVLILGLISNIINLNGEINAFWQRIVTGVLLLGAVFMQWRPERQGREKL